MTRKDQKRQEPIEEQEEFEEDSFEKGLYEGDHGTLPMEVRNLLISLLKGPYLVASENPRLWDQLINNKELVLQQLSNLYLTLMIDDIDGIAFIKQADTGDLQVPTLLTRTEYRLLDSVLIVELRGRLMEAETAGQRAVISKDEIYSYLGYFDVDSKLDQLGAKRRADAVIERFVKRHFLTALPNRGNYEISPVLKVIFRANEIAALSEAYEELLRGKTTNTQLEEIDDV